MSKINQFVEFYGKEEMDSEGAATLIDEALKFIPSDVQSVLSVGSGSGYEVRKLQERGIKVRGVDFNPENSSELVDQGDMHELPYGDKEYDLVLARDVFEHATAPIVAFSEMCRVSKKYVFIVLPDESWALSELHTLIPTLKQMIVFGIKMDFALDYFYENLHQLNNAFVGQSYYIFRRKV